MGIEAVPRTIEFVWDEGRQAAIRMVDQRALPSSLEFLEVVRVEELVDAIQDLAVRGAPALGLAGAMGVALHAANRLEDGEEGVAELRRVAGVLAHARPTAVNLQWGVEQALSVVDEALEAGLSARALARALAVRVEELVEEDESVNRAIGSNGAALLPAGACVLTHCNAGSLATGYFGTALGVVYAAFEEGKLACVYADETRPVGQGARLTMWELSRAGVPCTLECDGMAASLMASGKVDAVVVGADRIAANGDTANKIGTRMLAIAAAYHGVPFYVAAPMSTVDATLHDGSGIPIEFRDGREVIHAEGFDVDVYNPAFDVTPASLIAGIVTELGVLEPSLIGDVADGKVSPEKAAINRNQS